MRTRTASHRGMRSVAVLFAVAAGVGVLTAGSQSAGSTSTGSVLATGRSHTTVVATVTFPGASEGATTQALVVGRLGSSSDPASGASVAEPANQLPSETAVAADALTVRFVPSAPGTYPVFVFAQQDSGCASSSMAMEDAGPVEVTAVGVVRVR